MKDGVQGMNPMVAAAVTASMFPAKTMTAITTIAIPQLHQDPKSIILQQCKTRKELKQIHAHLIKTRLILNPFITENLLESAAIVLPNAMDYALYIFRSIDEPECSPYNLMIRVLTYRQSPRDAILLFKQMCDDMVHPDEFSFSAAFKACSKLRGFAEGQQIHAHAVKLGFQSNEFVDVH